jgi:hypothetical protein
MFIMRLIIKYDIVFISDKNEAIQRLMEPKGNRRQLMFGDMIWERENEIITL